MIYFARIGKSGPIKIGFTTQLGCRLGSHVAVFGKLTVLGVMDGDPADEKATHRMFDHLRIAKNRWKSREVYRGDPELLAYIEANCREPDEDERPDLSTVKVRKGMLYKAKVVAEQLGMTFFDYMNMILAERIQADFNVMVKAMAGELEEEMQG